MIYHTLLMDTDRSGAFVTVDSGEAKEAVVQARFVAISGANWGNAVLKFQGSASDSGQRFDEIDPLIRLSDEGITRPINIAGIRRFRVTLHETSGFNDTRAEITIGLSSN